MGFKEDLNANTHVAAILAEHRDGSQCMILAYQILRIAAHRKGVSMEDPLWRELANALMAISVEMNIDPLGHDGFNIVKAYGAKK